MKCPFTLKVRRGGGTHKMRRRSQGSVRVGCFGGYHGAIVKPGALVEPATLVESAALVEPDALLPSSSADPLPGVDDETLRYFWRKDPTIKAQQDFSSHLLPLVEPAALPPSSSADTPPGHKMRRRSQAAVHVGHFVVEPAARVEPTALLPSSFADPGGPPPDMDDEMVRRLWRKDPMFFKDVDDEIVQHLGKLGRRDPTAKIKSLSILSMLFAQKPDEEVAQIVPQWAFEYKRLLLDNNKDVRRAANDTMSSLARAAKKGLAPNLKHLMGPWWFSQFDTVTEVAEVSRHSFEVEFPQSNERLSALMLSLEETLLYLFENLRLTTQALTDKVTLIDEIQDTRQRVIPSSIAAIGALIDILTGVKLQSDGGDRESAGVIKGYHNTVFEEIFSEATPSSLRPNKEHISELEERLLHMERIYQEASSGRTHLEAILERVLHGIEETAKLVLGEGDDFLVQHRPRRGKFDTVPVEADPGVILAKKICALLAQRFTNLSAEVDRYKADLASSQAEIDQLRTEANVHEAKRILWSEEEIAGLKEGVARLTPKVKKGKQALIPWIQILEQGKGVFHRRRNPNSLKQQWITIKKKESAVLAAKRRHARRPHPGCKQDGHPSRARVQRRSAKPLTSLS